MQEKVRIVGKEEGKEEGIKGLGRKETKSGMDRNGKLEKGCWKQVSLLLSPAALCLDYTQHTILRAPLTSALVSFACRLKLLLNRERFNRGNSPHGGPASTAC
jgi:hypothetical protein